MHTVDGEVAGNGGLGGAQTLSYGRTSKDTTSSWRVPEWTSICVDVWTDVCEGEEREDGFDGRMMLEVFGRFD